MNLAVARVILRVGAVGALLLGNVGCGAIYPELSTPVRPLGAALPLPPPPPDLLYVALAGAEIPDRTPDGRQWDKVGGSLPDPFAIVFVDDKELFRTEIQRDTLQPTWPKQPRKNYRIAPTAELRVEVWDANVVANRPICVRKVSAANRAERQQLLRCDSGAIVDLRLEPARARWGVGLYYELRSTRVFVTRVIAESPAGRAGLEKGDEILQVQGEDVSQLPEGSIKSLINQHSRRGLQLTLKKKKGGQRLTLELKEAAMYPLASEAIELQ